ncbi:MAG: Ig-like domain repeat protein [Actinomycetota bacterium]|nr:Ig-like domain repeat protein [Actinomycetota bacterium]
MRSDGDGCDDSEGMTATAPGNAAELVRAERHVLVTEWLAACDAAAPAMSPPDAVGAQKVVFAISSALASAVVAPSSPARSLVWAARTLVEPGANLDGALRQLACLREVLHRHMAQGLPPEAVLRAQNQTNSVLDSLVQTCASLVEERLEKAAFLDPLTGLLNRRAMERDLSREVARAERHGLRLSVVMIDLDGLKEVNDREGHTAGDQALRALADALQAGLRAEDSAYRVGGDEFLALLPETPEADVDAVVERILAAGPPAFSWGAATSAESGADAMTLLDAADQRLLERRRALRGVRPPSTPPGAPAANGERRWRERRLTAAVMRGAVLLVPMVAGVVAAIVTGRALSPPTGLAGITGWWAGVLSVSMITAAAVDRLARRLLPLAALLKLSMIFPDKAPSRLSIALRSGSVRALRDRIERLREQGLSTEPSQAAAEVLVLLEALRDHDRPTRGHSERVRAYTDLLAQELGLSAEDREHLRWAGLLHDIGKLAVDPAILNKEGALDSEELRVVHAHPTEGARVVAPLRGWLGEWAAAVEQHHERWDGKGYPAGLAGEDIALGARVVAVADAFEVMTAPRSYRSSLRPAAARAELARCAGSHFDPKVVRAFLSLSIGRLRWVMGPLAWIARVPVIAVLVNLSPAGAMVAGSGAATALAVGAGVVTLPPPAPTPQDAPAPDAGRPSATEAPPGQRPLSVEPGETLFSTPVPVPIEALDGATIAPGPAQPNTTRVTENTTRPVAPTTKPTGTTVPASNGTAILSAGDVTLADGSRFSLDLNGTKPGTGYDQLDVVGKVNLGGATLDVSLGFDPALGDSFIIINNDGDDPVVGTFAGLREKAIFSVSERRFQITYMGGGNGNDVVLTRVDMAATSTSLSSSRGRSIYGQPVTFVATITSTAADPTGTVTFAEGSALIGTARLDADGVARFTTSTLHAGAHTLIAEYGGNPVHAPSTSASFTQMVDKDTSTVSVTTSPENPVLGEPVSFSAVVTTANGGAATGTVTFTDGSTPLGTADIGSDNTATFTTSALSVGEHAVTASYSGDDNVTASTSEAVSRSVGKAAAGVTLASSANPSPAAEPVTLTATVTAPGEGMAVPSGTVTFHDGDAILGSIALDAAGSAALTVSLDAGEHIITATYEGDANYLSATSDPVTQVSTAD